MSTKKERQAARAKEPAPHCGRAGATTSLPAETRQLYEDVIADIDSIEADVLANLDALAADPDHGKIAANAARSLRLTRAGLTAAIEAADKAATEADDAPAKK